MVKFIFDLDGTITAQETLPLISKHFGIEEEISKLTMETVQGNIPFMESFIKRVHILGQLPVDEISELLKTVKLHSKVYDFIQQHKEDCVVATGNLSCWIDKLIEKIGCTCFSSDAEIKKNKVNRLTTILKKENVVEKFKNLGEKVVFIGDGNNDMEAMRLADVSISSGLTHYPAKSVITITDYLVFDEEALCRQLNQLY